MSKKIIVIGAGNIGKPAQAIIDSARRDGMDIELRSSQDEADFYRLALGENLQSAGYIAPMPPFISDEPKPGTRKPLTRKARKSKKVKNKIRGKSRRANRK